MSKSKRTKKVKQNTALAVVEHDPVTKAVKLMEEMNRSAKSLRAQVYQFYKGEMWLALKFGPGVKGCRKCLKAFINSSEYSSVCRYLQAAEVEVELQINSGSQPLTVLLMYYKYRKEDWYTISQALANKTSKKSFEKACLELEAKGNIEKVKPAKKSEPVDNLKTAKELVNLLTLYELDELRKSIIEVMNQLD
ncbi:hypothetical protein ACD631_16165 [Alteromonas macleodii]|uniref:hypothetical protein n=1 Tax=Alteromonas macleodii TaxID=28108 RepID=UPI0036F47A61